MKNSFHTIKWPLIILLGLAEAREGGGRRRLFGAAYIETGKGCTGSDYEYLGPHPISVSDCASRTLAEPLCSGGNGYFSYIMPE